MSYSTSLKEIFCEEFDSYDAAYQHMIELELGKIYQKEPFIFEQRLTNGEKVPSYGFKSETGGGFYQYAIIVSKEFVKLTVYKLNKNQMIFAAETGNLTLFIENFQDTEKMKDFALSTAMQNGHLQIVDYLVENFSNRKDPIWEAIRFDQIEILCCLLDKGLSLPKEWLAYCMHIDSFRAANEILINRKLHLKYNIPDLKTEWFLKVINDSSKTSKLVRKVLNL